MLLPPVANQVRAKTGTLAGASALSGFVTAQDGTPLAFSVLVNGFGHIDDVLLAQDQVAQTLAAATFGAGPGLATGGARPAAPVATWHQHRGRIRPR